MKVNAYFSNEEDEDVRLGEADVRPVVVVLCGCVFEGLRVRV